MSKKYYMAEGGCEYVYHLDYFIDIALDVGKPIIVESCKRDRGGEKWCKTYGEFIDTRDTCGKQCSDYEPRNGKSGCCTQCVAGFTGTGQFYRVNENGYIRKVPRNTQNRRCITGRGKIAFVN